MLAISFGLPDTSTQLLSSIERISDSPATVLTADSTGAPDPYSASLLTVLPTTLSEVSS